uniref:FH2 domain-containing protein n=1 Tax=Ascaris lumbricoides TaxID=6252 RepID=A0A0M3HVR2_ASCLU
MGNHIETLSSTQMRFTQTTLFVLCCDMLSPYIIFNVVLCSPQREQKLYSELRLTPDEVMDVTKMTSSWNFDGAKEYLEKKISLLPAEEAIEAIRRLEATFPPPSLSTILSNLTARQREKLKQLADSSDPNVFTEKVNQLIDKLPATEHTKARLFVLNMIFDGYGGRKLLRLTVP